MSPRAVRILAALSLLLPSGLRAEWAEVTAEQAIEACDLVVVGTLSKVDEAPEGRLAEGRGALDIQEILWSRHPAPEKVRFTLTWTVLGDCGPAVPTRPGTRGIWILERDDRWTLHAGHPSNFFPLEERGKLVETIRRKKKDADKSTPPECPRCRSADDVIPILYQTTPETIERSKREECVRGGTCPGPDAPNWRCKKCGKEWR